MDRKLGAIAALGIVFLVATLIGCGGQRGPQTATPGATDTPHQVNTEYHNLVQLAFWHRDRGEYEAALPLFQEALQIAESALGPQDPETARALENLASTHFHLGQHQQALPLFRRALDIRQAAPDGEPLALAGSLENLASTHFHLGQHQQALPLFQRALDLRQAAVGQRHADSLAALGNLVEAYLSAEQYSQALPLAQQAVQIQEDLLGPAHPTLAAALSNLGTANFRLGNYPAALPHYQRALAIREEALGPEHPDTAVALNNLALLRRHQGEYNTAQELYQRALDILEKAHGASHPDTATALDNLGDVYFTVGDYGRALPLFLQALAIRGEVLGPDHLDTATSLNNLGALYKHQGDYAQAQESYAQALDIMLTRLGAGHPGTATALDNLADLFATVGNYQQALDYFTQALAIREQALGPDHPDNAAFINNLAVLHRSVGNDAEAFRLSQRALAIRQETLGLDHPATATALNNLGTLYLDRGEFQQARQLIEQALEIRERTLGADHPSVAMSLNSLGVLHQSLGSHGEALQLFQRALAIEDGVFKNVFSVASEEQKLLFVQANQWSYNTTLSLVRQHLGNDPEAVRFGLELVLARKGIVQDAEAQTLAALAASLEGAALESWQRLGQHRSNLARLLLSGPTGQDPTAYRQAVAELRTAIATEERFLAQRSARLAQELAPVEPTPAALAQRLPAATVLVEFVRIRGQEAEGGAASEADRYLAFVLTPAGQVTMVDLGDAQKIDDKINSTMELVNDLPSHIALLKSYTQTTNAALAELYDLILRPLSGFLSIYSGLIVSPDGEINKVPLAALRTPEGQYLIERHTISYVASGRDLLRRSTGGPAGADLFLVADPDFDDARAFETSSVSGGSITFDRLPGTAVEAQVIPPLVSGGQKTVISRRQATEAAVKSATAPRVLHLATHGFFLEDVQLPVADLGTISSLIGDGQERGLGGVRELSPATVIDLPADTRLSSMARSGLAFAGANHATAAVSGDDGILTALEVAGMNLHGTDLVVLSACQTAVGEVSVGEGVFGLRRAFVLAGAQNLVMSLWLVLDDVTVAQMEEFYRAFGANESPAEALRQAQLKTINELRASTQAHPGIGEPLAPVKVWAPFIVQQSGP